MGYNLCRHDDMLSFMGADIQNVTTFLNERGVSHYIPIPVCMYVGITQVTFKDTAQI